MPPQLLQTIMGALQNRTAAPGQQLSEQFAKAQGADPTMVLRQLEQVHQVLGVLFVKTFQHLPNVANNISQTMKQLSRAVKEAQQAASVTDVVGKGENATQPAPPTPQPLGFSAASQGESVAPNSPT
jgi:hypothetical protein